MTINQPLITTHCAAAEEDIFLLDAQALSHDELHQLRQAANEAFAEYEAFTGAPYTRFECHEQFTATLKDELNHHLLVKRGNKFIASIFFQTFDNPSDTLYFGRLWVSPAERQQGIAGRLIKKMEEEALKSNKKGLKIQLFKIPKLIKYYKKRGFVFENDDESGPMYKWF